MLKLIFWSILAMATMAISTACGGDSPGSDPADASAGDGDTDSDSDADSDSDSDSDGGSAFGLEQLVGLYAEKTVVATIGSAQGLGTFENTGYYYGLCELTLDGDELTATSVSCHSRLESTSPVKTSMDEAVVQSLPPFVGVLSATFDGGEVHLEREELAVPLGIELDDPWNDELPSDKNDPRIWDQDGDGQPGISVNITGLGMTAKIFAVRVEQGWWEVDSQDDGRLVGLTHDSSRQSVIGATNPLFNMNIEDEPDPDPSKSTFELVPLAGDYDCEKLIAEMDAIFQ